MFLLRNKKNIFELSSIPPFIWNSDGDVPFGISVTAFVVMATVLSLLIVLQVQVSLTVVGFAT